ncbi:FHA domain-containing protein [Labedella endophytica]|uniref:FHA domain-containing protein n=1 Tax=Labedella endophytica TaxID=1523160 RepID=A0A433JWY1_9MICO|nr:FHA domain-containing protein [Labedella endophytica]RUR03609.1 FHA domain-containing protein [Labedella endophytica]
MTPETTVPHFRYRPTLTPEWLVVASSGCLLAVRLDVASERIEPLVALTRAGSSVQGLLDALTSSGLTNTPSFVLAFWLPGRLAADGVGVVARGEGRAMVSTPDGEVVVEAGGFASWTERHVDAATEVVFDLGDPGAAVVDLVLDGGAVWASRVAASDGSLDAASEVGPAAESEAPAPAETPAPSGAPAPPAPARHAADSAPVTAPEAAAPVSTPPAPPAPPTPPVPPAPPVSSPTDPAIAPATLDTVDPADDDPARDDGDLDDDPIEGHTIACPSRAVLAARAAERAAETPAPDPSAPVDTLGDHDGLTVLAEDLRAARQSGHLASTAPPPSFSVQRYELVLPSGVRQPLDAPVLLGRAPSVAGVPASALPHLVTLTGDDISRNHVRVAVEGGTVVVTDLHSSNGTLVVIPGRAPEKLRGGEPTPVIGGTLIDLGGGVTVRVQES